MTFPSQPSLWAFGDSQLCAPVRLIFGGDPVLLRNAVASLPADLCCCRMEFTILQAVLDPFGQEPGRWLPGASLALYDDPRSPTNHRAFRGLAHAIAAHLIERCRLDGVTLFHQGGGQEWVAALVAPPKQATACDTAPATSAT